MSIIPRWLKRLNIVEKIAVSGIIAVFIFVCVYVRWTETNSSTTKLEIDIKMIVPNTHKLEDIKYTNRNRNYNKRRYLYEDDKVVIHSSFNNNTYIYTHDPNYTGHVFGPKLADNREAKFLGHYGEINVWLKPDMILVYHSEINRWDKQAYPRTQDEFRSNLTYHKGKWVKYIKTLANKKRKEFYDLAAPYREYKRLEAIEYKKIRKEYKSSDKRKERKKAQDIYLKEQKSIKRIEEERFKKATTPIDDSKLFNN